MTDERRAGAAARWDSFCDELRALGAIVEDMSGAGELDRAEGYRYLTRLLRLALEMNLEHASARHPSFYSLSHETAKIGADNPDNLYLNANIDGRHRYEISGHVGTVPYLSFGSKENRYAIDGRMISTGEVDLNELEAGGDGRLTLTVAADDPGGNWLPATPESNMVIVRQTFDDRAAEIPARLTIRRLDPGEGHDLLDGDALAGQLDRSLGFVAGTARTFVGWVERFREGHFNAFQLGDQGFFQAAGGDPNIYYIYAFWRMAADEMIRVRSKVPACDYWNFQLTNIWMESLDYRHHRVHLNHRSAEVGGDGEVTIHVTHAPVPGLANNLVTTGHTQGVMLMRWVGAAEHPVPTLEVLPHSGGGA